MPAAMPTAAPAPTPAAASPAAAPAAIVAVPAVPAAIAVTAITAVATPVSTIAAAVMAAGHRVRTAAAKLGTPAAVSAACQRLNLAPPQHGIAQFYSGEAEGLLVQLPGWQYPIVIDTLSGGPEMVPDRNRFHVPPELAEVHARIERMLPGHILTGPIAIAPALRCTAL